MSRSQPKTHIGLIHELHVCIANLIDWEKQKYHYNWSTIIYYSQKQIHFGPLLWMVVDPPSQLHIISHLKYEFQKIKMRL